MEGEASKLTLNHAANSEQACGEVLILAGANDAIKAGLNAVCLTYNDAGRDVTTSQRTSIPDSISSLYGMFCTNAMLPPAITDLWGPHHNDWAKCKPCIDLIPGCQY